MQRSPGRQAHGTGPEAEHGVPAVALSAAALVRALVVSIVFLHVASAAVTLLGGGLFGLGKLLDVRREANLPTLWSTLVLLACAGVLVLIARVERHVGARSWPWRLLSIVFSYLAVDEAVSLHELASRPMRDAAGLGGALHYAWVLPAGVAVVALGVALAPFVLTLPPDTRTRFSLAGACYLAGALALELPESLLVSQRGDDDGLTVAMFGAIEEGLEMTGVAIFLVALVRYLLVAAPAWSVRVER